MDNYTHYIEINWQKPEAVDIWRGVISAIISECDTLRLYYIDWNILHCWLDSDDLKQWQSIAFQYGLPHDPRPHAYQAEDLEQKVFMQYVIDETVRWLGNIAEFEQGYNGALAHQSFNPSTFASLPRFIHTPLTEGIKRLLLTWHLAKHVNSCDKIQVLSATRYILDGFHEIELLKGDTPILASNCGNTTLQINDSTANTIRQVLQQIGFNSDILRSAGDSDYDRAMAWIMDKWNLADLIESQSGPSYVFPETRGLFSDDISIYKLRGIDKGGHIIEIIAEPFSGWYHVSRETS